MPSSKTIHIQDRDIHLLISLADAGVLSIPQIAILHFQERLEATKKRLQKLSRVKLIARFSKGESRQPLYTLTNTAKRILTDHGYVCSSGPPVTQRGHHALLWDVKAQIHREFESCAVFEKQHLVSRPTEGFSLRPDGFFQLGSASGIIGDYYLEIDRSSESRQIILEKIRAYYRFYKAGGALRWQDSGARRRFVVLIVCISPERVKSLEGALARSIFSNAKWVKIVTVNEVLPFLKERHGFC